MSQTFTNPERQALEDEIRRLRSQLQARDTEIVRLTHLASIDSLTEIPNRRQFEQEFTSRIAALHRFQHPFCLLFLDVDHFKPINDRHGHGTGDQVLKTIGQGLANELRQVDFVARLGGDEFVIILPVPGNAQALTAANRILQEIVPKINQQLGDLSISLSIGIAQATDNQNAKELLSQADAALYEAKRGGGGRAVVFSPPTS